MSKPKYATPRDRRVPSFGWRVQAVAEYMGTPLMPWQRQVVATAMELDPTTPGAWRYPLVVVSVPRQAGKTALLRAVSVDRMLAYPRHEIMMTAQTGKDARKRWAQIGTALDAKKKPATFNVYASRGGEKLEFLRNGSFISPFAPTPKSLHGDSLHFVSVDEAWAFDAENGHALETAITPTQLTVIDSQLWIVSTRGTAKSAYLNALIKKGRESIGLGPGAGIAYFEWSADEEASQRDPFSDEALAFHPAIGHTQTAAKIRTLATADVAAWRRSILNLHTDASASVIDLAIWDGLVTPAPRPSPDLVSLGYDVAADGSHAVIVAAWYTPSGDIALDVVLNEPGTAWVPSALRTLRQSGFARVCADDSGPTRTMNGLLKAELDDPRAVTVLNARDYGTACQLILDRVRAGTLIHKGDAALREAVSGVALRPLGGASAFDAEKSLAPVAALRAAAAAAFGVTTAPPPGPLIG